jgi:hypothetical protein
MSMMWMGAIKVRKFNLIDNKLEVIDVMTSCDINSQRRVSMM